MGQIDNSAKSHNSNNNNIIILLYTSTLVHIQPSTGGVFNSYNMYNIPLLATGLRRRLKM